MARRTFAVLRVRDLAAGRMLARGRGGVLGAASLIVPVGCLIGYLNTGIDTWGWAAAASLILFGPIAAWLALRSETLTVEHGRIDYRVAVAGIPVRDAQASAGCIQGIEVELVTTEGQYGKSESFSAMLRLAAPEIPPQLCLHESSSSERTVAEVQRIGMALDIRFQLDPRPREG